MKAPPIACPVAMVTACGPCGAPLEAGQQMAEVAREPQHLGDAIGLLAGAVDQHHDRHPRMTLDTVDDVRARRSAAALSM